MNYNDARHQLRTGDLLLWSGNGTFSRAIKLAQSRQFEPFASSISHVGLVVRGADIAELAPLYTDRVLTFESTTLNEVASARTGQLEAGVDLVSLALKLATYDGRCYHRALRGPDLDLARVAEFIADSVGLPYERHHARLAASVLARNKLLISDEDTSSRFCSELATALYEHVGVFSARGQDAEAICPAELADLEHWCELLDGFSFRVPVILTPGARA